MKTELNLWELTQLEQRLLNDWDAIVDERIDEMFAQVTTSKEPTKLWRDSSGNFSAATTVHVSRTFPNEEAYLAAKERNEHMSYSVFYAGGYKSGAAHWSISRAPGD